MEIFCSHWLQAVLGFFILFGCALSDDTAELINTTSASLNVLELLARAKNGATQNLMQSSSTYNPDVDLPTLEMIRRDGYPAEGHIVETDDGYLLGVHRIPNPGGYPVFLQHGLLSSSDDWVVLGPGKAFAYILADLGFDVWMGNYRGNTYSRAHVTLDPNQNKFWDFSYHELGIYDLPAMITFAYNHTNKPLLYVGHSMGTTGSFVMASKRPDMRDKVRLIICYAPVALVSHWTSVLRVFAVQLPEFQMIAQKYGYFELLPQNEATHLFTRLACDQDTEEEIMCENFLFVIGGFDYAQLNLTLIPAITGHDPAGSSTKCLMHYLQGYVSKMFREYDYGPIHNQEMYGTIDPPLYDPATMNFPFYFYYGHNDPLADPIDAVEWYNLLPDKYGITRVNWTEWTHLDFIWATDAAELLYYPTIEVMRRAINETTG